MTATALPSHIHAELALDQGRLSRNGSERSGVRSVSHAETTGMDQHVRVQSLHGVIVETLHFTPDSNHGVIVEEPAPMNGTLSGAELAAALDNEEEDDEDDITTERSVMHDPQWYEQRSPTFQQTSFPPRQASMNNPVSQQQQQQQSGAYPRSILQNRIETLTPPPRSSSCSVPVQQQAFPDRPRFALSDSGPASAPASPLESEQQGLPSVRRAVSDSRSHPRSAPSSPGLSVTPPMHQGPRTQPPTPTKYATFEEMGIQVKGANTDKEDCVIM